MLGRYWTISGGGRYLLVLRCLDLDGDGMARKNNSLFIIKSPEIIYSGNLVFLSNYPLVNMAGKSSEVPLRNGGGCRQVQLPRLLLGGQGLVFQLHFALSVMLERVLAADPSLVLKDPQLFRWSIFEHLWMQPAEHIRHQWSPDLSPGCEGEGGRGFNHFPASKNPPPSAPLAPHNRLVCLQVEIDEGQVQKDQKIGADSGKDQHLENLVMCSWRFTAKISWPY